MRMSGPSRLVQSEQARLFGGHMGLCSCFVLFLPREEQRTKWVDAIWCLLEDSSLSQARHELMISTLVLISSLNCNTYRKPKGEEGNSRLSWGRKSTGT